jgi:hypothetical protein
MRRREAKRNICMPERVLVRLLVRILGHEVGIGIGGALSVERAIVRAG